MPDPEELASRIADKEAQIESSTDKNFIQETQNQIHGLQVTLQIEIASQTGQDFDPGSDKN
jgi:hypothetical protein